MVETDYGLAGTLTPLPEIGGILTVSGNITGTLSQDENEQLIGVFSSMEDLLSGTLSDPGNLLGSLSSEDALTGTLSEPSDFGHYRGDYIVTPDFEGRVLTTNNKIMDADVTVQAIQVSITSNIQGGNTVYIGGELNYG